MTEAEKDHKHWSRVAGEWTAWARAPNHDAFWAYRTPLVRFIGGGGGKALGVGCGEGRISRELMALGYQVTATDPVDELVTAAAQARSAHGYAVAGATGLPFEDGCFDLVVAYNVLMDIANVLAALKEVRRVMCPTGRVVISVVHPIADHGCFSGMDANSPFIIQAPTTAGNVLKVWKNVTVCECISQNGRNPSKPMRQHWRTRGWRSHRSVNPCRTLMTNGTT